MFFSFKVINADQWNTVDNIEASLASSFSRLKGLDIWSKSAKSHDTQKNCEEARDDVTRSVWSTMVVVPEALVNPYRAKDESIGVAEVDATNKRTEGEATLCGDTSTNFSVSINISHVILNLDGFHSKSGDNTH